MTPAREFTEVATSPAAPMLGRCRPTAGAEVCRAPCPPATACALLWSTGDCQRPRSRPDTVSMEALRLDRVCCCRRGDTIEFSHRKFLEEPPDVRDRMTGF